MRLWRSFHAPGGAVHTKSNPRPFQSKRHRRGDRLEADGSLTAMFGLDKPNIAAVNGLAVGGGSELTLACAPIFVADQAEFFSPEDGSGGGSGLGLICYQKMRASEDSAEGPRTFAEGHQPDWRPALL